jgi:F420-dependent oxidoreductase-like protein
MRIGVITGDAIGRSAFERIRAEAHHAVEDGLQSFWLPQIFGLDALTTLAVLAPELPGIDLGVGVVPMQPRHPMALAQQALTVQMATGGRLQLGVGLSHQVVIETMFGIPWDRPVLRSREYLSALGPLIRDRAVAFTGETVSCAGAIDIPDPPAACPILLAALGSQMLKVAGTLADGTITWMTGPATLASHTVPAIVAAAEQAGRDAAPRVVASAPVCVTDDPDGARARAGEVLAMYGMLPSYRAMLDREGAAGPSDLTIAGTQEQVIEEVGRYAEAGATEFIALNFSEITEEYEATRAALRALALS